MRQVAAIFLVLLLSGCAGGVGRSDFAQAIHGDRVRSEDDQTLCFNYLVSTGSLSKRVREAEIQDRGLDCFKLVNANEVMQERRLRELEENAKRATDRAEKAVRRAERRAAEAERKASRAANCNRGLKAYCY